MIVFLFKIDLYTFEQNIENPYDQYSNVIATTPNEKVTACLPKVGDPDTSEALSNSNLAEKHD